MIMFGSRHIRGHDMSFFMFMMEMNELGCVDTSQGYPPSLMDAVAVLKIQCPRCGAKPYENCYRYAFGRWRLPIGQDEPHEERKAKAVLWLLAKGYKPC